MDLGVMRRLGHAWERVKSWVRLRRGVGVVSIDKLLV